MEIALRFLRYSEKIARAYSAIAQNSTLWKSTFKALFFRENKLSRFIDNKYFAGTNFREFYQKSRYRESFFL